MIYSTGSNLGAHRKNRTMSVKRQLKKATLSKREEQIMALLLSGNTYPAIAEQIGLTRSTVAGHAARI
jgi:DNA-binding CsgD family transcriptional regulator